MFQRIKSYFSNIKKNILLKYFLLKAQIRFYWSLISNPKTRQSGLIPIAAAWAVVVACAKIGAMIWVADKVASFIEGDTAFFESLLAAAAAFLTVATTAWVSLACGALDFAIQGFLTENITGNSTSLAGWTLMRDLANMFTVLGFVVIGISFTLRLESYGSKKALISLIMIALLINFSPLICGIIIDGSNLFSEFLLKGSSPSSMISEFKDLSQGVVEEILSSQPQVARNVHEQLGISMTVLFINLQIIVSFFTYAALIILRYVVLTILFMFSPLAFVCYAFPFSQKFTKSWWDNFLRWCFIGAIGFFFIWFAVQMLNFWKSTATYQEVSPGYWKPVVGYSMYHVMVIFLILMAGYKITKASSAIGASIAIGMVAGVAGYAQGRITGGAKKLGGQALQKIRGTKEDREPILPSWAGRGLERIGLRQRGATDTAVNKQVEEKTKQVSLAYASARARGDAGTMKSIQRDALTKRGPEGAAAMQAVVENKALHDTFGNDYNKMHDRISYAESAGAKDIRKNATKSVPVLEALNTRVIDKIQTSHPGWTQVRAQREAVIQAATRVPEEELDRNFVDSIDHTILRDAGARMTNKKREALKRNTAVSLAQEARTKPRGSVERRELMSKLHEINNL